MKIIPVISLAWLAVVAQLPAASPTNNLPSQDQSAALSATTTAPVFATKNGELLAGPAKPQDFPAWIANMRAYRQTMQARLITARGELTDPYANPALQWTQRSFIQPQSMAHDRYFYDPVKRCYTVKRYLADLAKRYGGIDSVLLWPTYPNIGIDDRNQYDFWRDLPGGLPALHSMVAEFHRHGARVLLPIMYWDHGTRDEGRPMPKALAELATAIGADGFNGDTMSPIPREFYTEALRAAHPLGLEPEKGLAGEFGALAWNVLSWGYWSPYHPQPGVDHYKFVEPRHLTHVCDRFAHDRCDMLQYAFFNGDGYESWENVWGIWNGLTLRDAEALRRISAIYRAVPELLVSPNYEPFTPTRITGVFATKFPGKEATLWTLINRANTPINGAQLEVPWSPGMWVFDLWHGAELPPEISGPAATLNFEIEAHGYGAILTTTSAPTTAVKSLIARIRTWAPIKLGDLPPEWKTLAQQVVDILQTPPATNTPDDMVLIPAGRFCFESTGVMVETSEGVDVQYPWENTPALTHKHPLQMKAFYIDRHPVTCARFKRFLDASGYRPKDDHNFLHNWSGDGFPAGWANKPVTWVSLEDARAYARWAGKRLPHEWEWQYAAQGTDARPYPWGSHADANRMPPFEHGRVQGPPADVDAYPLGASPFGVLDLMGSVWQWTDEYRDEHTRAAILKGGSSYRPEKSKWYFPQARTLTEHGKYLLMAPGLDRSASIGFRCAVDS